MNLQYVLWLLGSLVISLGLFAFMNRNKKGVSTQCLLMGVFGTVFGAILAKLVYYFAMINFVMMQGSHLLIQLIHLVVCVVQKSAFH